MHRTPSRDDRPAGNDPLPEDLAAFYAADPREDRIDTEAGWANLRSRLGQRAARRPLRALIAGVAMGGAIAASVILLPRSWHRSANDPLSTSPRPTPAVTAAAPDAEYRQVVGDLERALRAGRDHVEPETMAATDRSLAAIDRAIHDAEAALLADPTNAYVADWLRAMRRRKVTVLRQAVTDLNVSS
jgi:hypothetical protein